MRLAALVAATTVVAPASAQFYSNATIHTFAWAPDGISPVAPLIQASDGNLYGTTQGGGTNNAGIVFRIRDLDGTPTEEVIYSFTWPPDGQSPYGSLIEGSDGNLYGTTAIGGANNLGTVFKVTDLAGTPTEIVVYSFSRDPDGAFPLAALIQASDGNLYGTTTNGGLGGGTVFRISNLATEPLERVIHSFRGTADGSNPEVALIQASDGNLYGTTPIGGPSGGGTVFEISDLAGTPTERVIYSFSSSLYMPGGGPWALVQASDDSLYGTTGAGGVNHAGTVFRISDLGGAPTKADVYSFFSSATDGIGPVAALIQASDGGLYGTTARGGSGHGTVFEISDPSGTPTESIVYRFKGGVDGEDPRASVVQASDGNLYGTTEAGGAGAGTVFRISGGRLGVPPDWSRVVPTVPPPLVSINRSQ